MRQDSVVYRCDYCNESKLSNAQSCKHTIFEVTVKVVDVYEKRETIVKHVCSNCQQKFLDEHIFGMFMDAVDPEGGYNE